MVEPLFCQEIRTFVQVQQLSIASSGEKADKPTSETVTASVNLVKPVMASGPASTQRKTTVQPQAHIHV